MLGYGLGHLGIESHWEPKHKLIPAIGGGGGTSLVFFTHGLVIIGQLWV